jgi:hypothetical protein
VLEDGSLEAARLYESGSNLPIKVDLLDERSKEGYHLYHFYAVDTDTYLKARAESAGSDHPVIRQVQGGHYRYDLRPVVAQYERIKTTSAEERNLLYKELFAPKKRTFRTAQTSEIVKIIDGMNENGCWIEDMEIWDYTPGQLVEGRKTIQGISVGSFIKHMERMMSYLSGLND